MNGFGTLLIVIFLLYLVEWATWIPAGAIAFRLSPNKDAQLRLVTKLGVFIRSGVAVSYPPLFRSAIIACSMLPPASISPSGVLSEALNEFLAFEDISGIESSRRNVFINGHAFILASSEAQASDLARLLSRL
jgi:hypothetical protein